MTNILTPSEAALFLRTEDDNPLVAQLLPLVDEYIEGATGRDWTADIPIHGKAKAAALVLTLSWYDNPMMIGKSDDGVNGLLVQLESEALKYRKYQFDGRSGAGTIHLTGAMKGDVIEDLVGVRGVSGDQASKFESVISTDGVIAQTDGGDLSVNSYVVILKHPAEDVNA
jgi:hypothetical protein